MTQRTDLLAAITTALSTLTQFTVSQELPWRQNNQPLFRKNFKKVYVDQTDVEETTLIPTLSGVDVFQVQQTCAAYLAVDAKNPPSQLGSVITKILQCKSNINVINFGNESDYTLEIDEDVLVYSFEFRTFVATT
jgi:hypothetical protein